jgi:cytochrome c peroxidase
MTSKRKQRTLTLLLAVILVAAIIMLSLTGCSESAPNVPETPATYDPTPYVLDTKGLPPPPLPPDNALTVQKVKLGKMLFHERLLSKDGSQSCADCHVQTDGFSDTRRFSVGVEGSPGTRQAMAVFNMAWHRVGPGRGFFWDGRAALLRDQALRPIQDPLEMNETLPNAVAKLQASKTYRDQFMRAFGSDTVTSGRMALAMEQFMLSIVSGGSKFDKVQRGEATFTAAEQRGHDLFFREVNPATGAVGAECFHCHGGPNFSNDAFMNNGLDSPPQWTDLGRYEVTKDDRDRARFKVTSLRNIDLTPPYMHDGRFTTLEEVVRHYNTGVKGSPTVERDLLQFNLRPGGLGLSETQIADVVAFLKTLTDPDLVASAEYKP